jgi:hypothetical protein
MKQLLLLLMKSVRLLTLRRLREVDLVLQMILGAIIDPGPPDPASNFCRPFQRISALRFCGDYLAEEGSFLGCGKTAPTGSCYLAKKQPPRPPQRQAGSVRAFRKCVGVLLAKRNGFGDERVKSCGVAVSVVAVYH